ncbi:MAG: putative dipeptidase [Erysipelotrichaceae bacterium]|nr:MAG: dipeptidase [Erysipelotrichaceae bacterium]TXT16997.1 MAG: putative dipeptidase [Erysipelotrichaceae bacterium]
MDFYQAAVNKQEELIKTLQELVQIPSLSDPSTIAHNAPFGKALRDALDYMLNMAKVDGFKVRDLEGYAGVIEFGEGTEIMGVLGHLDVVPVGNGWSVDPFSATIKDGYIIGRGSQDDKGPSVAAYMAMKILKDAGFRPKKRVFMILGTDEESGMACMKYYKKHGEIPDFGFVPDADFPVIYGEKGILQLTIKGDRSTQIISLKAGERPNICIGEASVIMSGEAKTELFDFYLKTNHVSGHIEDTTEGVAYFIKGKYAHGSMPQEGINAAWHCLNFVGSAYGDETAFELARYLKEYRGDALGVRIFGSHMGFLTVNLGIINITKQHTDLVLDIRYPQETNEVNILSSIQKALDSSLPEFKVSIKEHKGPLFVDPKSKLVSTLEKIYRDYSHDQQSQLMTMGGGTYARSFDNFVAFGAEFPLKKRPSWVGNVHQADEGYEIEQLVMATAIYAQAIYDLTSN